jgi:hypothetical protein
MIKVIEKVLQRLHKDHKALRQVLGVIMMFTFIYFVLFLYGLMTLISVTGLNNPVDIIMAFVGTMHLWMPYVMLIIIIYLLLTRVYPYEK